MVNKKTIICKKEDSEMFEMNEEQRKRLLDFCGMTDLEFYERYLADLTLEEQAAFMDEFPEF